MMDQAQGRPKLRTLKFFLNLASSSQIHSEEVTTSWSFVRLSCGLISPTKLLCQLTPISEISPPKSSTPPPKKFHGLVLSKNTQFLRTTPNSRFNHMDGQTLATQPTRAHTTAQSVVTSASEEPSLMLTTKHAFTLDLRFLEQMLRSCPANGNFRLDHVLVLNKVTTYGPQDIFSAEYQNMKDLP